MIQNARVNGRRDEIETFFRDTFTTDNPLITEAVKRMLAAGGKRLRPRLTLMAAHVRDPKPDRHLQLAAYMELIHVATLIHDDVVDNAQTRRGVNATAVDFGNRISVLAGDYLFAWIFKNVTESYPPPIPNILSAVLAEICDGEVLQLRSLGDLSLSQDAYVEIVAKKTASLFAAAAECGAIAGGASAREVRALRDFGLNYGIAFQMRDDLLDVTADAATLGKPVGNDLAERKMTIPLILALQTGGADLCGMVERFYEGREQDTGAVIDGIRRSGAVEATRTQIAEYAGRAEHSLQPLQDGAAKDELRLLAAEVTEKLF
ncbi:MAG TPA: polyprenyl synthetase family protein [Candidatus Rubrimentiphilum sp.]|nr:polyprenyl synthetase family protein [Candidatus Rubrimentiphilum sp.]